MYDIIIIGGGPAGLTAATYARRAGRSVLVIEKHAFGGQITWSPKVENFPSVLSISGTELGDRLLEQAMEHGAEVELDEVTGVSLENIGSYFGGKKHSTIKHSIDVVEERIKKDPTYKTSVHSLINNFRNGG